jgi:hypothetical protein
MSALTCCGIELAGDLPEGAIPLEALAIVKCVAADGTAKLQLLVSPRLESWEVVGMTDHLQRTVHRLMTEQNGP